MTDTPGLSIRFVQQFDVAGAYVVHRPDVALLLAMEDTRDVSMGQKLEDAFEFVTARLQSVDEITDTEPSNP